MELLLFTVYKYNYNYCSGSHVCVCVSFEGGTGGKTMTIQLLIEAEQDGMHGTVVPANNSAIN